MTKQKRNVKSEIVNEAKRIIFETDDKLTYRKLAHNLEISIGLINYHYPNKEMLFQAIHRLKIKEAKGLNFTQSIYLIISEMGKISQENNQEFINTMFRIMPQIIWIEYSSYLEQKFKQEFGQVNKECIVAIITQIQMLLISGVSIQLYLGITNSEDLILYINKIINYTLNTYGINLEELNH